MTESHNMAVLPGSSPTIVRWGDRLLAGGLSLGVLGSLAVCWYAPALAPLPPLVLCASALLLFLFRHPFINLAAVLGAYALLITTTPGIQVEEVVYGLYYIAYLVIWYGNRLLIQREGIVHNMVDRAAAALIVFGLFGGIVLGLTLGAELEGVRGEALAFSMILFYFPVKDACLRYRYGPDAIFAILMWYGIVVAVRNALGFRRALASAARLIEISGARAALNEMHLLVGVLSMLVLLIVAYKRRTQLLLLLPFLFYVAALLMTKARGFWVDALFGAFALFFLLGVRERTRLVVFSVGGLALFAFLVTTLFSGVGTLLVQGVIERFSTLQDAAVQDISLVNRFNETASVWERIKANPVLGYGLGASHTYYDWIHRATMTRVFSHNGYVSLWFKFGVWGSVLMYVLWFGSIWAGIKAYRLPGRLLRYRAFALSAAVSLIAIIPSVSTSAPFFVDDSLLSFTILVAFCSGLYGRLRRTPPAPAPHVE